MNLASAHWKARVKNRILPALQNKFEAALQKGEILELTATAESFVDELVSEALAETHS